MKTDDIIEGKLISIELNMEYINIFIIQSNVYKCK